MTKAEIRHKVWQTIQREGAARFPGAYGRIPHFVGAEQAAQLLREMAVWRRALVVKVNPDAPQLPVRRLALAEGKIIYMAVPRLRTEKCFVEIVAERITMLPHDLPVDFLVTPTEVIATRPAHPRPRGIYWDLLRALKINAIPLLRKRLKRGSTGTPSPRRL